MEPPVVANYLYKKLPEITKLFKNIYLHNIDGDGYSLQNVDKNKIKKFYWPIPYKNIIDKIWSNDSRSSNYVMINGNNKPTAFINELYSKRIEVLISLSKLSKVDLFGHGWKNWWSKRSWWYPYIKNYSRLIHLYRGYCNNKFEVLKNYNFCLCFENMEMKGYISEKIFDCFYAGTIPIYLGAKDINKYIPEETFIDFRRFENISDLNNFIKKMNKNEIMKFKKNSKDFILSNGAKKFYNSFDDIVKRL